MKKINFTKEWFYTFSANIAGVIIGIVLTFGITFYVQHRQEQKKLRDLVSLLEREIKDNKAWLESRANEWNKDLEACWVVLDKQRWDSIPGDSLQSVASQLRRYNVSYSASYIWGVFQNAGMVQKLQNAELVSMLSECYFWSDDMRGWWRRYNEEKLVVQDIYQPQHSPFPLDYFEAILNDRSARKFIDNTAVFNTYNFPEFYRSSAPLYDYTLFLLENYDRPRKTRGIDFETFRKMRQEQTNPRQK